MNFWDDENRRAYVQREIRESSAEVPSSVELYSSRVQQEGRHGHHLEASG